MKRIGDRAISRSWARAVVCCALLVGCGTSDGEEGDAGSDAGLPDTSNAACELSCRMDGPTDLKWEYCGGWNVQDVTNTYNPPGDALGQLVRIDYVFQGGQVVCTYVYPDGETPQNTEFHCTSAGQHLACTLTWASPDASEPSSISCQLDGVPC